MRVGINTLGLGDIIELFDDGYGTATVQQVTADEVIAFRPYVHTADFSYTGGVMCYIGTETVKMGRCSDRTVKLLRKAGPLK